MTVTTDTERAKTQNVVAIWEGSDPVLKDEMVAISYCDHVWTNPNAGPGQDIQRGRRRRIGHGRRALHCRGAISLKHGQNAQCFSYGIAARKGPVGQRVL